MLQQFNDLIKAAGTNFNLDPKVIEAVIMTESLGLQWSCKYEPNYSYLVNPRDYADHLVISFDTEVMLQRTSLGLMHPMGGVCREHGFKGMLTEILKPELSIQYGCQHLKLKAERYGTDPSTLYAAYNAGSVQKTTGGMFINQKNVDRFMVNLNAL